MLIDNISSKSSILYSVFLTPLSVRYMSNGKTLNATVWLYSNFEEPLLKDSIDVYQEQLKIKVSNLTTALSSSHISIDKYAKGKIVGNC
jgi:hypothetical protein